MPDFNNINWLAVVACVIVSMGSGFIWYHPRLFFPAWWSGIRKSGEPGNPNPMMYVFTIIAPTNLVNKLFAGHGFHVWAIEAGNHLLNFLLFGAIMGAWH